MDALTQLSQKLLDGVKSGLGNAFANLSAHDQSLIVECCTDAAQLQIDALAAPADATAAAIFKGRTADINAQLNNIAALEATNAQETFWNVVADVTNFAANALVKVALTAAVAA